jgi:hypothetical protein
MYLILGVQANQRQVVVATPANADEARSRYEEALKSFEQVLIQDSNGNVIDISELSIGTTGANNA